MNRRCELPETDQEKLIEEVERRLGAKPVFRKGQWVKVLGDEVGKILSVHLSGSKHSRNRRKYAVVFFAKRSSTARTRAFWFTDLRRP